MLFRDPSCKWCPSHNNWNNQSREFFCREQKTCHIPVRTVSHQLEQSLPQLTGNGCKSPSRAQPFQRGVLWQLPGFIRGIPADGLTKSWDVQAMTMSVPPLFCLEKIQAWRNTIQTEHAALSLSSHTSATANQLTLATGQMTSSLEWRLRMEPEVCLPSTLNRNLKVLN